MSNFKVGQTVWYGNPSCIAGVQEGKATILNPIEQGAVHHWLFTIFLKF